jgi:hypothetical protein
MVQEELDFSRGQDIGSGPSLGALANELDGIPIKQLMPPGMIEEHRHQVADFGATASG